jgi:hypothetical protein
MSVDIDYFVNYPKDIQGLADDINSWIGCNLLPYEGNKRLYFAPYLGMEFALRVHSLENDQELDFENFTYELGFRTSGGAGGKAPIQLPALLVVVYALHHSLGIRGMLVYEVESVLARYVERDINGYGRRLFDVLSQTPFVSFPAHLSLVSKRLPDSWQDFYGDSPTDPGD